MTAPRKTLGNAPQFRAYTLPWAQLPSPVSVGDIEFLPRAVAIERAGPLAEHVEKATSYFRGRRKKRSIERPIEPAVVFIGITREQELRAELRPILCFATCAANDSTGAYANGAVFTAWTQGVGGDPGLIAASTRRRTGSFTNGFMVDDYIVVRPHWSGTFHEGADGDLLTLTCISTTRCGSLATHSTLWSALSDSDEIDSELDLSLCLRRDAGGHRGYA